MGILKWLGIGADIAKPIEAVSSLYTTDKERLKAEAELESVIQKPQLQRLDINQIFASAESFFNNGWQSLTGWTSGFCIALYWIPQLVIANIIWASECFTQHKVIPFPIDPSDLFHLIYLLFGFGTYHIAKSKLLGK
jgi:hypothetical protein